MHRALLVKGVVCAVAASAVLYAQCLPVISGSFNVNGIVVGRALNSGGTHTAGPCAADAGWGGVASNTFVPVLGGDPNSFSAQMFGAALASGPNIDRIYLGLHVESDDKFSPGDILTLYVDANKNGSFDAVDFAVKIEIGPLTTPTTEDCDKPVNHLTFYRFENGNWTEKPLPMSTAITAKTSFDYNSNMPDTESNLWELEIEIRPSDLGTPLPTATGIAMGAKLWIDQANPEIPPVALVFPQALNTTNGDPACTDAGAGAPGDIVCPGAAVNAGTQLAKMTVGNCGFDVIIEDINGSDHNGTPGRITRGYPNPIVGTPAKQSTFSATLKFVNPANLADMSPLAVPNSGTVNFIGRPYYAGDFHGSFTIGTPTINFTQLGKSEAVSFKWPANEAQYAPARPLIEPSNVEHVCLQVTVSGFTVNANPNDFKQQNLFFTQASTIKDRFVIASQRQEGPGGVNTYYLRALWENLPEKLINKDPRYPKRGLWSYRFTNAARIGLKHVKGNWYSVDLKPNEQRVVEIELTGGTMPDRVRQFLLSPRAGGQAAYPASGEKPVAIPVKPGMTITAVASGLITVDAQRYRAPNGPDGFIDREGRGEYLLSAKSNYTGRNHVGALIGSFDGFKTSFLIGGVRTFIVPDNATRLSFAVNDVAGAFSDNGGKGFLVSVVLTPPLGLPTRVARAGNPNNGQPAAPELGSSLPRLNIDMNLLDPRKKFLRPAGYVAFVVYNSHPR